MTRHRRKHPMPVLRLRSSARRPGTPTTLRRHGLTALRLTIRRQTLLWPALLCLCLLSPATQAATPRPGKIRAAFSIFWASLPIFSARFSAAIEGTRYRIEYKARTRGPLALIVKANTTNRVSGVIHGGRLLPRRYSDVLIWRKYRSSSVLAFLPRGVRATYRPAREAKNRRKVRAADLANAIDPLTALLQRISSPKARPPCAGRQRLFDGRQLFELRFTDGGMADLPVDGLSPRRGKALRCRVTYRHLVDTQIKHNDVARKSANIRDSSTPITIWLQYQPKERLWLPVRAEGGTRLGGVTAVLIRFSATP